MERARPSDSPEAPPPADQAGRSIEVRVYFTRDEEPEPVRRTVLLPENARSARAGESDERGEGAEERRRATLLRATMERLLEGPSAEEEAEGLGSWFSSETAGMIRNVALDGSVAIVDFEDFSRIISGASSSFGSTVLLGELNRTVFQFPWIDAVEYRMEGSCDAFWKWIQRRCETVSRASVSGGRVSPGIGAEHSGTPGPFPSVYSDARRPAAPLGRRPGSVWTAVHSHDFERA